MGDNDYGNFTCYSCKRVLPVDPDGEPFHVLPPVSEGSEDVSVCRDCYHDCTLHCFACGVDRLYTEGDQPTKVGGYSICDAECGAVRRTSEEETMGYDSEERNRVIEEEAEKAVRALSDFVNVLGQDKARAEAFVKFVDREHRTLQQGMMRLVIATLENWDKALDAHNYDGRNEAACKLARKLLSNTDKYDRGLPCI